MNARIQENTTNHGGSFLMGLMTGSAIGAGLAIYFSRRLALELRQRVADIADDVTRRGQAARNDVADAVARGAHEVGRGAREVEQFAKASKTEHTAARS